MSAKHFGTRREYRVQSVSRSRCVVVDQEGRRYGCPTSRALAQERVEVLQRRDERARNARDRPCLCCGRTFRSEGIHNRLCTPCRAGADDLPPQFTTPAAVARPRASR